MLFSMGLKKVKSISITKNKYVFVSALFRAGTTEDRMNLLFEFIFYYVRKNLIIFVLFVSYGISSYLFPEKWYCNIFLHYLICAFVLVFAENFDGRIMVKIGSFINKIMVVFLVLNLLSFVSFWLANFVASAFGAFRSSMDILAGTAVPYSYKEILIRDGLNVFMEALLYASCSVLLYVPARIDYNSIRSVRMSFVRWPINFFVLFVFGFLIFGLEYIFKKNEAYIWVDICSGLYICGLPLLAFVMGRIEYDLELKQCYE